MNMNKKGIVCASDTELAPFLPHIEKFQVTEHAMLKFYEGFLGKAPVTAVYSGVCKVNAAIAAQILIDRYQANILVNTGTAGGMAENVQLFDTVISEQTTYHDVAGDVLTKFHPWLDDIYFASNSKLLAIARNYSSGSKHSILFGKTVTGEQFIADNKRDQINQAFSPLSVDMETASIAHVCYANNIPFIAVLTVTDTASHKGIENFEKNCKTASEISAEIVMELAETFALTEI